MGNYHPRRRRRPHEAWSKDHALHKAIVARLERGGTFDEIATDIRRLCQTYDRLQPKPAGLNITYCPVHKSTRMPCGLCQTEANLKQDDPDEPH